METKMKEGYTDLMVHYGTCDFCKSKNIQTVHYNYTNQIKEGFRLCSQCIGRGIISYTKPVHSFIFKRNTRKYILLNKKQQDKLFKVFGLGERDDKI